MPKREGCKQLWRGLFAYRSELQKEFVYAYSKEQAKVMMCRRLAKKHEVHPSHVYALFDGSKPNFEISLETEYEEVSDGV